MYMEIKEKIEVDAEEVKFEVEKSDEYLAITIRNKNEENIEIKKRML